MQNDNYHEKFRKSGVLAFCAKCGLPKPEYRKVCKSCGLDPRKNDNHLVRSILMSTEQHYLLSKAWESKTPEENANIIELEIIPKLIENANILRSGRDVNFNSHEEANLIHRIKADKQIKPPKSLGCFLITLYALIAAVVIAFVKFVVFK